MNQAYEDGRRANEFAKACREKYITDNMPKKKKPSKPNPEVIPNVPLWPGDLFDLPIGSISAHEFKRECLNEPEPEESQTLYTIDEVKEILHNYHCDMFKWPREKVFPEPNWKTEWIDKNLIQRKKQ